MQATTLKMLDEDDYNDKDDQLLESIQTAIKNESIKLPAMPDIVMRIRDAFKNEQYDINMIARIVQTEAGLAAYVVKVANSPLHRGPIPITTAKHAVCRLGQTSVQSIVLTYTVRSLFETSSSKLKTLLQDQWHQSTNIAAISAVLAERCEDFDPDQALLAGLLQDIGALPIIDWLKDNAAEGEDINEEFKRLCKANAKEIGVLILRSWQFAEELVDVVKNRENWSRDSGIEVDTTDIVTLARAHYYMGKKGTGECPAITDIPAYHKLEFKELSPDQSLALLDEAKEEIEEVRKMLM